MIPQFETKEELFKFLKANKALLINEKKMAIKYADAVSCVANAGTEGKESAEKEAGVIDTMDANKIVVRAVINTTKILDSHGDVHIDGIWKKSLSENKSIYHLQEHMMKFDKVITDEVKAYTKSMTWKSLGFDYEGSTQALVFDSTIDKERNEFMYDQYTKGYVKNHSVGMRYVKMEMAINSEAKWYDEEKAVWDKYINTIVNKDVAEEQGYFWVVTEAKVIEGSAVLVGSNRATPTMSITGAGKTTPEDIEPEQSTHKSSFDMMQTILLTQKNK